MNRRDFCRNLALIVSAGALTTQQQLDALERTFFLSAPDNPIAVHDIYLSLDCAPCDKVALVEFRIKEAVLLPMAFNFRSSMRLCLPPHGTILTTFDDFNWTAVSPIREPGQVRSRQAEDIADILTGWVNWIDENGKQQRTSIKGRHSLERAS